MSPKADPILQVYQTGPTTVVGFGGRDVLSEVNVASCREELLALIEREQCRIVAFDLTGVRLLPSGLLGVLTSLRSHGIQVQVYNPSLDVREVLATTNLDKVMEIRHVDIPAQEE